MFLSRMELDTTKRKTLIALSSPSMFHGAVESAFPGERRRNLWRVDQLGGRKYLLILSEEKPDLTAAMEQFGVDGETWLTKDYDPLLNRIVNGTKWHFRLAANPTYSVTEAGKSRGRVCAHSTAAHQRDWLVAQSEKHGFRLAEDTFDVVLSRWYHFGKGNAQTAHGRHRQVSLLSVTFEGDLEVTDAKLFKELLVSGIGREKAYGVGLMTLVQIKENGNG